VHKLKYKYLGTSVVSHLLSCVCFTSNRRREIRNVCNLFQGAEYTSKKPTLNLKLNLTESISQNSSGSIVTRLWAGSPTIYSLTPGRGKRFLSFSNAPYQLWELPSLLSSKYNGLFPQQECSLGVKLTVNLCLLPRLRTEAVRPPFPHMPSWQS
jgi:hypothetical protein